MYMIIASIGSMNVDAYRAEIATKSYAGHGATAELFYDVILETR